MFRKVLIANRGEIAVRILRTCREMGLSTVSLYQAADRGSLHVRLADECVLLESPEGFQDQQAILRIAQEKGADAIHPGYGFLAERQDFIQACEAQGIVFIGPPSQVVDTLTNKVEVLKRARAAGFPTAEFSSASYDLLDVKALRAEAEQLGYPVLIKSARGGRGRGSRLAWSSDHLLKTVRQAQRESLVIYGNTRVYLEKAILPAHQIGVQVVGDREGALVHLGEREGSLLYGNQKIVEEAPAPGLTQPQRQHIWQAALELARLFGYENVGTVEFLVDLQGNFYFTEIKPRIQIEHPLTEALTQVDLVSQQIRIAAGQPLNLCQDDIRLNGWALLGRISAKDPWQRFMPSPGYLRQVRLPGGQGVRVDTYLYCGCTIPSEYDPLIAKLIVWGQDRPAAVQRMQRALQEFQLVGAANNLPMIQRILTQSDFVQGEYIKGASASALGRLPESEEHFRRLALAAALVYVRRNQMSDPLLPDRLVSGWHRHSRRLPQ
ncbi:MAG: biotin carboxylase N-terminal domain-containing protein [Chloroflexota bacterium]